MCVYYDDITMIIEVRYLLVLSIQDNASIDGEDIILSHHQRIEIYGNQEINTGERRGETINRSIRREEGKKRKRGERRSIWREEEEGEEVPISLISGC